MFTFQSSTNTALAQEQFSYDTNLRITNATATWQSGSGTSGTVYSQALGYDAASNITSSTTTQAVVSGATNSGGSETEIYCYDEQNRLVWAGNSGTPQGASNGTCGTGTPSNSLSNATYSNQYVYTHLGQLWQGPYNGSGSYQYLYCNSSQPHQLTGLYPTGTTCSTTSGKTQSYAASYDSWGNMTTRTASGTGGTTATLSDDGQDHLMRWNDTNTTTNEEWYMYDASGQRVLRRSQTGTGNSNTKYTITAFGLEDHIYDGGGTSLNNKYYYSLAGHLIGLNNGSILFLLTDALGSVVASISNTANSASVKGNQVYGPYGNNPYSKGTMGTTRGYTGQYNDALTQLDYYLARYYDPLVGIFLSADKVQGDLQGMDPYAYVGENPETRSDPTGERFIDASGQQAPLGSITTSSPYSNQPASIVDQHAVAYQNLLNPGTAYNGLLLLLNAFLNDHNSWVQAESYAEYQLHSSLLYLLGLQAWYLIHDGGINWNYDNTTRHLFMHLNGLALAYAMAATGTSLDSAGMTDANLLVNDSETTLAAETNPTQGCSFSAKTLVTTAQGKQAIGKLHAGEKVLAYNPKTHKMELQPILHVWIDKDNDLVDLIITTISRKGQSHALTAASEVIHTNKKHPFLTQEKGFLPVGQIKLGMHVLQADGQWGLITGWKVVPGSMTMYNLEVAQDHTFTVGAGQWVVHNCSIDGKSAAHIFRDAPGHLPDDTPDNRQLLISTASDGSNYVGTDKYGNEWYSRLIEGGKQVWVQVRNGIIRNGGVNDVPRPWDPGTGFSSPTRP